MAITETAAADLTHDPGPGARRTAAGAAALLGLGLFVTVAAVDVPLKASDGELLQWWQQSEHRTSGVVSGFAAICAALAYPVVTNYVTGRRASAGTPLWRAFARSMTAAVTALWLVTGAVRASIGHVVDVADEPLPGVDSLRLVTAINYALLGLSGMAVLGLSILAISVVVLRTAGLQRWIGYVGLACSVVILASVIAQYGAYTTALAVVWALCLAVAIWRHDKRAAHS